MKISAAKRNSILKKCSSGTVQARGRAFEDLLIYLFSKIRGISHSTRNTHNLFNSEEIDVAFFNNQEDLFFIDFFVLVECKNWSRPVGSSVVVDFIDKLRARKLKYGILFAANGVTGDPADLTSAHHKMARALEEGITVIVIKQSDIQNVTNGLEIVEVIRSRLMDYASKGAQDL